MKKVLAIILALLMVLSFASLAACGEKKEETKTPETNNEQTTPADGEITEEVLKASKPNEYVQEKLDAGWEMDIDWSLHNDNYFVHTQLAEAGMAKLAEYGFGGTIFAAPDNNIAEQISQMETICTKGESCGVIVQTSDPGALETVVGQLQESGITVVIYGIECDYDTIVAMADVYQAGYGAAVMAHEWAKVRYPDEVVKCAVLGAQINVPTVTLSQGMLDGVEEYENLELTYYGDNEGDCLENGYNGAEAALMLDGDIKIFICYQMSAGLGVNNYLEAQAKDFGEYGIFGTSEDDTTAEMLEKAANNQSAFRGTISAGGGVPDTAVNTMVEALLGDGVALGTLRVDPMKAWTSTDYTCDFTIGY